MSECQRCDRPVQDARICTLCGRDLERALGNVPSIAEELDLTISRQRRFELRGDGSRSASTPVPFHTAASEAYWTLRNILVSWCKFYADETATDPIEGPACTACLHISCSLVRRARNPLPADNLTALSRFLMGRTEWLRHHELALDAVNEITDAVHSAARIVDAPAYRSTFPVGPCPEVDDLNQPCPGEVRAYLPKADADPPRLECAYCHKVYETHQWMKAGPRIERRKRQIAEAAS